MDDHRIVVGVACAIDVLVPINCHTLHSSFGHWIGNCFIFLALANDEIMKIAISSYSFGVELRNFVKGSK